MCVFGQSGQGAFLGQSGQGAFFDSLAKVSFRKAWPGCTYRTAEVRFKRDWPRCVFCDSLATVLISRTVGQDIFGERLSKLHF
jgi:hypothetical protein